MCQMYKRTFIFERKRLLTKYQIFMKLTQISHTHKKILILKVHSKKIAAYFTMFYC